MTRKSVTRRINTEFQSRFFCRNNKSSFWKMETKMAADSIVIIV